MPPFKAENIGFRLVRARTTTGIAGGDATSRVAKWKPPVSPTTGSVGTGGGGFQVRFGNAGSRSPRNTAPVRVAGIDVAIDHVERWSGNDPYSQPVGGPRIFLTLSGAGLVGAKGIRTVAGEARDDTGGRLRRSTAAPQVFRPGGEPGDDGDGKFRAMRKPQLGGGAGEQMLDYYAPSSASSMKILVGHIELLIPKNDPASIIAAGFDRDAGKPLRNDVLKAAGVEITLMSTPPGNGNQLSYMIKDPKTLVGAVEFCDAGGGLLTSNGYFFAGDASAMTKGFSFNNPVHANAVAKFYVITEKSVVKVPFEFRDIPAPN